MARNIEIKARAPRWDGHLAAAARVGRPSGDWLQEDTFFSCRNGRLKLRTIRPAADPAAPAEAVLIFYRRPDAAGPKGSDYSLVPVPEPAGLAALLGAALGVVATVRKRRRLFLAGRTRIHLDEVEGLGRFIELEVVLSPTDDDAAGTVEAERLMGSLGIAQADLVAGAYADLLVPTDGPR